MVSLVVLLAIVMVVVIRTLSKRTSGSSGQDRRARLRAQTTYGFQQAQQQLDTSQARPAGAGDVRSPPPATGAAGGPPPPAAWTPTAAPEPQAEPRPSVPGVADPDQEDLPAVDEPGTEDGSTVARPDPATERYVGSAALDSSLDSTIESSLLGMPAGPVTLDTLPGGPALNLPAALETEVLALLDDGHEVAAVRLVCDEMDCGILEATRTVRSVT